MQLDAYTHIHTHSVQCHVSFQMTEDEVCGNRGTGVVVWRRMDVGECVGERVCVHVSVCVCVGGVGGSHWGKPALG